MLVLPTSNGVVLECLGMSNSNSVLYTPARGKFKAGATSSSIIFALKFLFSRCSWLVASGCWVEVVGCCSDSTLRDFE